MYTDLYDTFLGERSVFDWFEVLHSTFNVMSSQSVNLITLFLGKHRIPKRLTNAHSAACLIEWVVWWKWPWNIYRSVSCFIPIDVFSKLLHTPNIYICSETPNVLKSNWWLWKTIAAFYLKKKWKRSTRGKTQPPPPPPKNQMVGP